ncbi:hypothetical protein CC1G_10455 [Coprinopsis cinerea okayama7|uniref:Uncharacterized protein n=1 Tax=Coprinopsis cinerea (strain Okayama-7 / 130 / ATCC MYA-4618 / FGSC 9003) TaxID=240176 RepID=A8PDU4_COPC7|nr:hypothetical protein CC1G_10455 [Coprinopsis cinerea okayama7\|eukprot:XP_001840669.1 hypothetical protein CC1G_10455 [Coprinopsis cinerea okayama7\
MSTETARFLELSNASRRLIWEIYASRNRSPREALLILLEHSRIVKDLRKSLGLDAKTLDRPIKLLFSEIAKNHATYLDKDVKSKPHIILDTGFLSRLPPLPPDFQPPDDILDDVNAAGAMKGKTSANTKNGTSTRGGEGEGEGKRRGVRSARQGGVGEEEEEEEEARGNDGEGGMGVQGDVLMDDAEEGYIWEGDERGGDPLDGDEGVGGTGRGKDGEGEGEDDEEGDGRKMKDSGQGGGALRKRDNTHMSPQAKRTKKKKVDFDNSATRPSPPPQDVDSMPGGGVTRRTTRRQAAKAGSKGGVKSGMKGGGKAVKGDGKPAEGSKGPVVAEPEDEIDETQCPPPEPGKGFDVTDQPCSLCIAAEQRVCWRPAVGSCHRCRLKKQKCTFSKKANPKAPPPRATSSTGASSSGSVLLPSGQSQWALYSLPSGLPAGTIVGSSEFARRQDVDLLSSATQDLQADVYSMRGQLHDQAEKAAEKMDKVTVRLGEVEEECEKVHVDVVKVAVEVEDIRAQFEEIRGHVPDGSTDMEKVLEDLAAMDERIKQQERQFGLFKQRFGGRLAQEVEERVATFGERQDGKWIPRFELVDERLAEIDRRLRELEEGPKLEQRLGHVISREVSSRFQESERRLEGSFKRALEQESQHLADRQVDPADVAKEVSQSLERHWPALLTPILSTTLTTHLRERIGDIDANIARVGEELEGRLRAIVQEEISRNSQDIIREAVNAAMRNLTVHVPSSTDIRLPPYPTFIDPDLFEQAYEPLILPSGGADQGTSISTFQLQDPEGVFQAGIQESVLTAVPDGVSSVRARRRASAGTIQSDGEEESD